jgi:hypothetical protein
MLEASAAFISKAVSLYVCRPAVVFLTALPLRISLTRVGSGTSRIPYSGQDQAKKRQDRERKIDGESTIKNKETSFDHAVESPFPNP